MPLQKPQSLQDIELLLGRSIIQSDTEPVDAPEGTLWLDPNDTNTGNTVVDVLKQDFEGHKAESASRHITESGSNVNGSWLRFDDGTQIIRGRVTLNNRQYDDRVHCDWTFPKPFTNNDYQFFVTLPMWNSASFTAINRQKISNVGGFGADGRNTVLERPTAFLTESNTDPTREIRDVHVMAIGRWK